MSRSAAILHAETDALARLSLEGGLLDGFLGRFEGPLPDTAGGAEGSLDDLLGRHAVVAVEGPLLAAAPIDGAERALRRNLQAKVEGRLSVRLLVLSGTDDEAAGRIGELLQCPCPPRSAADRGGATKAVLVVVLERPPLSARLRGALAEAVSSGCFRCIYLMTSVLEQAGRVVIRAENVWPVSVGRLLVALSARPDEWWSSWDDKSTRLLLWRTIAWGTDGPSGANAPVWERAFLDRLQATLLPTSDATTPTPASESDTQAIANPEGRRPPPVIDWASDPESYGENVTRAVGDDALVARTIEYGSAARPTFIDKESRISEQLEGPVRNTWEAIAGAGGSSRPESFVALQRLSQARPSATGGSQVVEQLRESAANRVGTRLTQLDTLKQRRDRVLYRATPTLELARARFVPLWWRGLIGVAVWLSVLALLLGVLVPLRPLTRPEATGPSFMGVPLRQRSVAFLVDRSGSMAGFRLEKLKAELDAAVDSLPSDAKFTIAAFSTDTTFLPGGERTLLPVTNASREAASDWIKTLAAEGGTRAAEGLERLVGVAPSEIVLLTDGAIEDSVRVAEIVNSLDAKTKIRLNTIALFGDSGEDFLREISKATEGTYTFVPFDPFTPPGFPWVIALIITATALGACVGVLLPWWLERRAGRAAATELAACAAKVQSEFETHLNEGQAIVSSMSDLLRAREKVSVGAFQRSLGVRALGVIRSLFAAAANASLATAACRRVHSRGPLAEEDRADARHLLDIPLDGPAQGNDADADSLIDVTAIQAAVDLRESWARLCLAHDTAGPCGNVPARAIERDFGRALESTLGTWPLMLLLRRPSIDDDHFTVTTTTSLAGELETRLGDSGNHADLLSAPIDQDVPLFLSECRRRQWIELTKGQIFRVVNRIPARLPAIYQRMRAERRDVLESALQKTLFEDPNDAPPGVAALGLVHEEVRIELFDGTLPPELASLGDDQTRPETFSTATPRSSTSGYVLRRWS
jgi:uncharacterized protein YegL